MMTLTQEELNEIRNYLMEQPTKFSLPLINYLSKKEQEEAMKLQEEKSSEDGK